MSIRDNLSTRSAECASMGAFSVLNGLQDTPDPTSQVLGLATAYLITCRTLDIDPQYPMTIVDRMIRDCRYREVNTITAVEQYVKNELRGKI